MIAFFRHAAEVMHHPVRFGLHVIKAFRANQGLLLAGALAYYALLSIVPLLILIVIALSHFLDQAELLDMVGRALEWVAPGQSTVVVHELATFLEAHAALSWLLTGTMLLFSSVAFTVLEGAMSVIFMHRLAVRRRRFIVSVIIPFGYIFFLGLALLVGTLVQASLESVGKESIIIFGRAWSLGGVSGVLLYIVGVLIEMLFIASVYLDMPFGRLSLLHAMIGGVTAGILWEAIRHSLVWYFNTISQVGVVYGSFTSVIVVLLSFEMGATVLLLGAQVIAEYERVENNATRGRSSHQPPGTRH